ncbi:MAG: flagellar motor protein MotB [Thermoleophilaceae bacterium]
MSARGGRRRRRRSTDHENEERWLLTYADMITLLMALFMVLFSISSVNISKYQSLQESLKDAFSGKILPGGKQIQQSGSSGTSATPRATPSIRPQLPAIEQKAKAAEAAKVQAEFKKIKQEIDSYAKQHKISMQLQTVITKRGLIVRLLTDKVLFDPGQAVLKTPAAPLLTNVAHALNIDKSHPIMVEGHTDSVPISGSQFPSNWELSTARASVVVRFMIRTGVDKYRLGAAGYAYLYPVASNNTEAGRSKNRRVEIVLLRQNQSITPDSPGNG